MRMLFYIFLYAGFLVACIGYRPEKNVVNAQSAMPVPTRIFQDDKKDLGVIRKALQEYMDEQEFGDLSKDYRHFTYEKIDLNDDGEKEYMVGLQNSFFCGTGGCTYLLLDDEGNRVTSFSVARAPFIVLPTTSNGWHDLVVFTGHQMRKLTFDGDTYPSNPSTEPVYEDDLEDDWQRVLNIEPGTLPEYEF